MNFDEISRNRWTGILGQRYVCRALANHYHIDCPSIIPSYWSSDQDLEKDIAELFTKEEAVDYIESYVLRKM